LNKLSVLRGTCVVLLLDFFQNSSRIHAYYNPSELSLDTNGDEMTIDRDELVKDLYPILKNPLIRPKSNVRLRGEK